MSTFISLMRKASPNSIARMGPVGNTAVHVAPYLLFLLPPLFFNGGIDIWVNPLLIAIAAVVGLNILTGTAGLISLGQAAFMAVGAYTSVAIALSEGLPFVAALVISPTIGAVIGLIVGFSTSRLRGLYGVLSTLALEFIVVYIGMTWENDKVTSAFLLPNASLFGWNIGTSDRWYIVLAILTIGCLELYRRLLRTHVGRAWEVVNHRNDTAAMLGINVRRYELYAWITSGAIVALVGCVQAYNLGTVSSDFFTLTVAIQYFAMIVIGGRGSVMGCVVGAAVIITVPFEMQAVLNSIQGAGSAAASLSDYEAVAYGLLLTLFLVAAPDGLVGRATALLERLRRVAGGKGWLHSKDGQAASSSELAETKAELAIGLTEHPFADAESDTFVAAALVDAPSSAHNGKPWLLEIEDLTVGYRGAGIALENIEIRVGEGEVVAVLGPNGAGKSTLLRSIAGFAPEEPGVVVSGAVRYKGADLSRIKSFKRAQRGLVLVPERDKVFPQMTVEENLELACPRGKSTAQAIEEVLALFPALNNRLGLASGLLSGGERQMLAIARALVLEPVLLLLDETSLGLAPIVARRVMEEIRSAVQATSVSVLLVEQNVGLAELVADRYYLLQNGRIAAAGRFGSETSIGVLAGGYFGEPIGD